MFTKDDVLDIDYNSVQKNKVPILIFDANFKNFFSEIKGKDFLSQKEELESYLKEQKSVDNEIKKMINDKRKTMTDIINLSHRVNNGDNSYLERLKMCKENIYVINEKIDELTFRSETLPSLIRVSNFNLLKITAKYAYEIIKESSDKVNNLNSEIETLRDKLRKNIEEKNIHEEKKNATYGFLHGILGHNEMEKLDSKLL